MVQYFFNFNKIRFEIFFESYKKELLRGKDGLVHLNASVEATGQRTIDTLAESMEQVKRDIQEFKEIIHYPVYLIGIGPSQP